MGTRKKRSAATAAPKEFQKTVLACPLCKTPQVFEHRPSDVVFCNRCFIVTGAKVRCAE